LRADELAAVAVFQSLQHQARSQPGFAHRGWANENDIFCFGEEVQFGEGADLFAADSGLAVEGKGFQRPAFGQVGAPDAVLQGLLLSVVPLRTQQAGEELGVTDVLVFGGTQLFFINSSMRWGLRFLTKEPDARPFSTTENVMRFWGERFEQR